MSKNVPATVEPKARSLSELARPTNIVEVGGFVFKEAKALTLPTLKHNSGEIIHIRVDSPLIVEEKSAEQVEAGEGKTITLVHVTTIKDGQQFKYVVNAITAKELEKQFPEPKEVDGEEVPGYVGEFFAIRKLAQREGKRYKDVQIIHLIPATDDEAAKAGFAIDSRDKANPLAEEKAPA